MYIPVIHCIHIVALPCAIAYNKTHTTVMKKSKKSLGLGREHKDVTCAVRLPQTMYEQLCEVASKENSSISDVIRSSLVKRIEEFADKDMERQLKAAQLEAELRKLREA